MKNKTGNRIYKRVEIRIVTPPGMKDERLRFVAPARQGYGDDAIAGILQHAANTLELQNPDLEFRLVELAPDRFNFVYQGPKGSRAPTQP